MLVKTMWDNDEKYMRILYGRNLISLWKTVSFLFLPNKHVKRERN